MDFYGEEQLARSRHRELAELARTDDLARRARQSWRGGRAHGFAAPDGVRGWRLSVARRLVDAGLRIGMPARRRHTAFDYADSILSGEELAGGGASPGC